MWSHRWASWIMIICDEGTERDADLGVAWDLVPWSQDDLLRLDDDSSLLGQASLQGSQDLHRWSRWITQWHHFRTLSLDNPHISHSRYILCASVQDKSQIISAFFVLFFPFLLELCEKRPTKDVIHDYSKNRLSFTNFVNILSTDNR